MKSMGPPPILVVFFMTFSHKHKETIMAPWLSRSTAEYLHVVLIINLEYINT